MRRVRIWSGSLVLGAAVALAGCHEAPAPNNGWGLQDFPEVEPTKGSVFHAARQVVAERYAQSRASELQDFVIAYSPVTLEGASKTRKQISVLVSRNMTGAFEPVVRVRRYIETEPPMEGDPETANAATAFPIARNDWKLLDALPYEEQELYEAIMARLQPRPTSG